MSKDEAKKESQASVIRCLMEDLSCQRSRNWFMECSTSYVFGILRIILAKNVLPERKRKMKCDHNPIVFANEAELFDRERINKLTEKVTGNWEPQVRDLLWVWPHLTKAHHKSAFSVTWSLPKILIISSLLLPLLNISLNVLLLPAYLPLKVVCRDHHRGWGQMYCNLNEQQERRKKSFYVIDVSQ